jgi:deoxyribodipyrimidine photo-lyase
MSRTSGIVPPTILRYSEQTNMTVSEFAISSKMVPSIGIRTCNAAPLRGSSSYVLYGMIANRRLSYNFALDRALEYCRELRKPLVIFEALRCGYQWASDRFHRFVIDGMAKMRAPARGVASNTILTSSRDPERAKGFFRAFDFRRHLQKVLPGHLTAFPAADPLGTSDLPASPELRSSITSRWPPVSPALLAATGGSLGAFPIDHAVKPAAMVGGHSAAGN